MTADDRTIADLDRRGYRHAGATLSASVVVGLAAIPGVVFASIVVLLFAVWPLFVGAYVELGIVPWEGHRNSQSISAVWWLLTACWLAALGLLARRGWRRLRRSRRGRRG